MCEVRKCGVCETPLTGRQRRYCSKPCANKSAHKKRVEDPDAHARMIAYSRSKQQEKNEWARNARAQKHHSFYEERTCPVCSDTFTVRKDNPRSRTTCSDMCRYYDKHGKWKQSALKWKDCAVCGSQYRGVKCNTHGEHSRVPWVKCSLCGSMFVSRAGGFPACGSCREHFVPTCKKKFKATSAKRRRVYERDAYTCQICGESVDANADPLSDWFPSLDHVVPRSHGGDNSDDNLRTAHRWCNAVRGNETYYTDSDLRAAV